jgi:phosphoribosylanthranilate isomerase
MIATRSCTSTAPLPARPRLKVCCISSIDEARLAISYGASAIGLVSSMPSGPGVIPETLITEIAAVTPPGVATFLLTSERRVAAIVEQQRRCQVNTLQLCDELRPDQLARLRAALPGVAIVQVIHVTGPESLAMAQAAAAAAHALLLDSGNPGKQVKELGGTGRTHDWQISRQICETVELPVFLAGGLGPDNIAAAVSMVRPYGIDVCSGLRSNGKLDESKLAQLMARLDTAWKDLSAQRRQS